MAITATVVIAASVATVSALAGGVLVQGQTMTYGAQSQPVSPAVSLGSQLSGPTGGNGTYNVNQLVTLASTTVTFLAIDQPVPTPITTANQTVPTTNYATQQPSDVNTSYPVIPPTPLPETLFGSSVQTSYST